MGPANSLLKGGAHMNWLLKEGLISEKMWIVFKCCLFPATLAAEGLSPAFGLTCIRLSEVTHCLSRIEIKPRISRSCVGHRQLSRRGPGETVPPRQTKNLK